MKEKLDKRVHQLKILWPGLNTHVMVYLVQAKINAVIDTGPKQGEDNSLISELAACGLKPSNVSIVLNTHGHPDHIGNDAILKKAGAKVMIHKNDAIFLEDQGASFDFYSAPLTKALGNEATLDQQKKGFLQSVGPQLKVDKKLEDNEVVDLGNGIELRVIPLPGHTPGSVGYYWEKEGILFNGDSVSGFGSPGGALPIYLDLPAYVESVKRLKQIPVRHILSCHTYQAASIPPSYIISGEENIKKYLEASQKISEELIAAIVPCINSDKTLMEIGDLVISRLPLELGYTKVSAMPPMMAEFSLITIYWGLQKLKKA